MNLLRILVTGLVLSAFQLACAPPPAQQPDPDNSTTIDVPDVPDLPDPPADIKPLLLIGLDGFKPDYLDSSLYGATPNFDRLIEHGVLADSLKPVFPTKTFVNLYSVVTGLYPENHGIVGNVVYDPDRDARLHMSDSEMQRLSFWWGGEPIWVTAERQGKRAGTFFWVGSEAEIQGYRPTHWVPYNSAIPHRERIDTVLEWLTDDEPVDFASLYFAAVDGAGHAHGPRSQGVVSAVQQMDRQLGVILDGLEEAGLWPDNINIILISDHGMTALDEEKLIMLDDIIDTRRAHIIEWTPVAMIAPRDGFADEIYRQLEENQDNYTVYWKHDLPERFRLKNNPRVPEIIVIADMPYTITSHSFFEQRGLMKGGHGYDPEYEEMHGFFLAAGPHIRQAHRAPTLELVDIYSLMAHLLGLEAAENDGSLERIGPEVLRSH